jgi:acyl carrier protein
VRSPHLARGYLDDDPLTAARFSINPFTDNNGDRLYKTGDMGRYLPDGAVEFAGRIDDQVKIRGYRIELGEIEVVLGQHPGIREVVATVREDSPGDKRLVAYVVAQDGTALESRELRTYLKAKLPDYMVASAFVFMDALPLTPNGKVDWRRLPAAELVQRDFVAPRTPIEELLAQIWSDVLKLDKVGIHDNFFDLGGHSLLATQVVSRLRKFYKFEIPLRMLFEASTLEELATMITMQQAGQVSETQMERILAELEAMSDEGVERNYKDQKPK